MDRIIDMDLMLTCVNMYCQDGRTPLLRAADKGQTEIAKMLLEKGADVEAKDNEVSHMY